MGTEGMDDTQASDEAESTDETDGNDEFSEDPSLPDDQWRVTSCYKLGPDFEKRRCTLLAIDESGIYAQAPLVDVKASESLYLFTPKSPGAIMDQVVLDSEGFPRNALALDLRTVPATQIGSLQVDNDIASESFTSMRDRTVANYNWVRAFTSPFPKAKSTWWPYAVRRDRGHYAEFIALFPYGSPEIDITRPVPFNTAFELDRVLFLETDWPHALFLSRLSWKGKMAPIQLAKENPEWDDQILDAWYQPNSDVVYFTVGSQRSDGLTAVYGVDTADDLAGPIQTVVHADEHAGRLITELAFIEHGNRVIYSVVELEFDGVMHDSATGDGDIYSRSIRWMDGVLKSGDPVLLTVGDDIRLPRDLLFTPEQDRIFYWARPDKNTPEKRYTIELTESAGMPESDVFLPPLVNDFQYTPGTFFVVGSGRYQLYARGNDGLGRLYEFGADDEFPTTPRLVPTPGRPDEHLGGPFFYDANGRLELCSERELNSPAHRAYFIDYRADPDGIVHAFEFELELGLLDSRSQDGRWLLYKTWDAESPDQVVHFLRDLHHPQEPSHIIEAAEFSSWQTTTFVGR